MGPVGAIERLTVNSKTPLVQKQDYLTSPSFENMVEKTVSQHIQSAEYTVRMLLWSSTLGERPLTTPYPMGPRHTRVTEVGSQGYI